jgi:hypothetical protein
MEFLLGMQLIAVLIAFVGYAVSTLRSQFGRL